MSECIPYQGGIDRHGYGKRLVVGRWVGAHRYAYAISRGLPLSALAGKVVMHTCDNPRCVNPEHLVLGTQADNMADMIRKGRSTNQDNRKLTLQDAEIIRKRYIPNSRKDSQAAIARDYGVGLSTINKIINGLRYNHG